MDRNILRDLKTVMKFVEDVGGHGQVKIIHLLYQRKDEGPRAITVYLACLLLIVFPLVIFFSFFFSSFLFFLLSVTLFLPFFILFTFLFLFDKGVSKWLLLWGPGYILFGLVP